MWWSRRVNTMLYFLLAAALAALDQLTKALVRANIPLGGEVSFLPGVLGLTHAQNTGAAFSLFASHTWILTLISLVMSLLLIVALKKDLFPHPLGRLCLAAILAGAVGNLIDRLLFGQVTDMFKTLFMDFPIFNVADICLTLGVAVLFVYILFFDKTSKGGEEHGGTPADG